jgi:H+-transporting ATPase
LIDSYFVLLILFSRSAFSFFVIDAARAAADIVLTQPGLSTIVNGIIIARRIFGRIRSFLLYRIAATLQLLVFFFIAVLALRPVEFMPDNWETNGDFPDKKEWPEYFHMPVLMLMLITLLNDGTLIAIGYDEVEPRQLPEKWNLSSLYFISSVLAFVAMVSSVLLLYFLLDSWTPHHVFQGLTLGGISYGQVITSIYLKISISDFLTLFSARTGENFFWTTAPSPVLLGAGGLALTCSTILALTWPASSPDGIYTVGLGRMKPYGLAAYIWIYCILWWFIQDCAKVFSYWLMKRYNWFHYNDTGKLILPESTLQYLKDHKERDLEKLSKPSSGHH